MTLSPVPPPAGARRGLTLVAVLAAMATVLLLLGGMIEIALVGRRQLLRELDACQAECLLEAAADRAVARLRADPGWSGGAERVPAEAIVGRGDAAVSTSVAADSLTLRVVVEYPAGDPRSIRRERAFAVAPPAPSTVPAPSAASPESSP